MLKLLKNSGDPFDSALGPTHFGLQFWVLMQKNRRNLYNALHISALIFVLSQYVELWIIRKDLELAMRNLSVTMLSTVCVFKAGTFVFWEKSWSELLDYVSNLEVKQLSKKDPLTKNIIDEYTRYSRKVTYFYRVLITATVFVVIMAPLFSFLSSVEYRDRIRNGTVPYPEVLSSWVPFDRTRGFGYWVVSIEQAFVCFYGGGVVANFDCNAVVIMSFFAGQLRLLSANCDRLFDDGDKLVTYKTAMKRIKECHYHHLYLMKYTAVLNSLLSPVLFLYVIICSLMICASAIQLTTEGTGNMQRIWIAEYLMALIVQLFLYCWHGNEVLYMSNQVDAGVYSSAWWSQEVRVRRSLLLLGGQLRKSVVFTAGPFAKLNVATFVAILKGSYSYFTLLENNKED
ncbi:odorant receptor 4-like [Anticarsia gemmatalis]|uniref:odorant receptor 4-like n=1 Tax=Anticarsia gemmatalis TaxID=129554 RepID=UPI003F7613CB